MPWLLKSKPAHEKQHDDDDQHDTDDTDAAMTEAVAVAAEPATESAEQEDDEDDDEDKSDRHVLPRVANLTMDRASVASYHVALTDSLRMTP